MTQPMTAYSTSLSCAKELDRTDPLAAYRERFLFPKRKDGEPCTYLCGNSLGLQPTTAAEFVKQELDDWARLGVDAHFRAQHPWMPYHELLTEQTARLVGARPVEVVVMNTLTVNLHLMLVSFYQPTRTRYKILMESKAFPSDQYAIQSQVRHRGYDPESAIVEVSPRVGETHLRTEDILELLESDGDTIALIMLGGVNYYSGQCLDLQAITRAGHARDCIVGFDLAHAAGNVELNLHDSGVDFAVWCSYKYLNGGPGCIAGCFVHEHHATRTDLHRFAGWWGHNKSTRFRMPQQFEPIPGAEGWQLSNPPILSLAALRAAMDIFDEVGMPRLRAKSEQLTGYLEFLLQQECNGFARILTPESPGMRGCQLSIRFSANGKQFFDELRKQDIVCDWREPDVIRVAPVPLYNTYRDVYRFVEVLSKFHNGRPGIEPL